MYVETNSETYSYKHLLSTIIGRKYNEKIFHLIHDGLRFAHKSLDEPFIVLKYCLNGMTRINFKRKRHCIKSEIFYGSKFRCYNMI